MASEKRLILISVLYLALGFLIFICGFYFPGHLNWLENLTTNMSTIFGSLKTSSRVNSNPIPSQLVILYVLATLIPMIAFVTTSLMRDSKWVSRAKEKTIENRNSKVKTIITSLIFAALCLVLITVFLLEPYVIGRLERSIFSNSVGSVFFLLMTGVLIGIWSVPIFLSVAFSAMQMSATTFYTDK